MAKANLITRAGYQKLEQELRDLWRVERRETVEKVSWAASLGDRSENADYKYNKAKLRKIDSRIRYLSKRLDQVKVVDYSPQQDGKVFFGAFVEVESDTGDIRRFQIVGPDEIYQQAKVISIDSPMARALLKKTVDDEASVTTPKGEQLWYINKIQYQPFAAE
ncbi:transcription elongation factor GreB [Idiomarina seosinensis]|uniref:Transcription elongation factor GreB n=1 Tax=Idiomarina seosinensis TaxID=281739 RepID=A0A432ZDN5_9GAMM|nr:transcription elongation factor GreB [Idiomarina seosinensis]RUO76004.1 transcription elongation factor GreB [Idiomarina seosinensis]